MLRYRIKKHKHKTNFPSENQVKTAQIIKKPDWIKVRLVSDTSNIRRVQSTLDNNGLHSVCEEGACPNRVECFNGGTAAFMLLGAICTRSCPFCDVSHGRPLPPDINEPQKLVKAIDELKLKYVVLTSVCRDDLHDGGAKHFSECISFIRNHTQGVRIEILTPDFRGCMAQALDILGRTPPDVFNHNLENVPRLYKTLRPGADYKRSLDLLAAFKKMHPEIPTKSGLMIGLGESRTEIISVMQELHDHGVTMLTLGQYLQPGPYHLPVQRYATPAEFEELRLIACEIGFTHAACGPLVRSSYHAEQQFND